MDTLKGRRLSFEEAISHMKNEKRAKFDETVEVCINLESKTKDVVSRGSVEAPSGLGRKVIIAVFCDGVPEGADYYGGEELIQKFLDGSIKKCDVCISTRKYIPMVSSKIGKLLGRRRIMPDARFGTVTEDNKEDISKVINSFKHGRMNFRANKNVIHGIIGKMSFDTKSLEENFETLIREIKATLPEKTSISRVYVAPTMGKSLEVKLGGA